MRCSEGLQVTPVHAGVNRKLSIKTENVSKGSEKQLFG